MRLADKMLLRLFDRVIMVSDATRRLVPAWWLPDSRVRVLHNALVLDSYGSSVLAAPRRVVNPAQSATIVNVGRLSPEKGQILLLQVIASLAGRWPGLKLIFAGTGPLEHVLRETAVALGISERVEFRGYVSDMPALYSECDLLVQSSFSEGLPNVVLEAAYLRLPMVATDVGGTAEVVQHRRTAWLCSPTAASLSEGIEAFLTDPSSFARMGVSAHDVIVRNFSFGARTARQTGIYEELRQ
ncbi:MAG: glycosyltransferase [Proteobacteria bacterium]|nr:glycosyltransferase [Pseudomonadota bacterium]